MKIDKGTICASPFVGVFSIITEKIALLPHNTHPKEETKFRKLFETETIKAKLADTALLGVMASGINEKLVVSELVTETEIKELENNGLKIKKISGITAIGNLIKVNSKGGIASKALSQNQKKEIEDFLGLKLFTMSIADSDIVGSAITVSPNGFIVHPDTSKAEIKHLNKLFGEGTTTTLNYGDKFVGNSSIAGSKAILVGSRTTTFELIRVSDIFS